MQVVQNWGANTVNCDITCEDDRFAGCNLVNGIKIDCVCVERMITTEILDPGTFPVDDPSSNYIAKDATLIQNTPSAKCWPTDISTTFTTDSGVEDSDYLE